MKPWEGDGSVSAEKFGPSRQKIKRDAASGTVRKKRKCLSCRTEFMSTGPENHICNRCKEKKAVFKGSALDYPASTGSRVASYRS